MITCKSNINSDQEDIHLKFNLFTDGSAINNSQNANAGWAVWFPLYKKLIAKEMIGTNNQAELEAIRFGLWYVIQNYIDTNIPENTIYIYSDSEYAINSITGKHKPKVNSEKIHICKELIKEINTKHKIVFIHVQAHTKGSDYLSINNAIVDEAARKRALRK